MLRLSWILFVLVLGTASFAQSVSSCVVSPGTVTAGCSATGTVTLSTAPSSNVTVTLASSTSLVSTPSSVVVPAGSTFATFPVTTLANGSNYIAGVSANVGTSLQIGNFNIVQDGIATVTLAPSTITANTSTTGTVTLSAPTSGDFTVNLAASTPLVTVPPTVVVPAGTTTATFTATAAAQGVSYTASISAASPQSLAIQPLTVLQNSIAAVSLAPSTITASTKTTGTVTLSAPTTGAFVVSLSSSTPLVTVPSTVTVPAGASSVTFTATAAADGLNYTASIGARSPQSSASQMLNVVQDSIAALSFSPAAITAGTITTGTVTLSYPTTGDFTVTLSSSTNLVSVPTTVIIPAGLTSATFTTSSKANGLNYTASVAARSPQSAVSQPINVSEDSISSLVLAQSTVTAGTSTTGTVTLATAPTGPFTINLAASTGYVTVPATVVIPAGSTSATFPIVTKPNGNNYTAGIGAKCPQSNVIQSLAVNQERIQSVSLSPSVLTAGQSSQCTVNLNFPAPPGGWTMTVTGGPPLMVPASIVIPAGASTLTFTINTTSVPSSDLAGVYVHTANQIGVAYLQVNGRPWSPWSTYGGNNQRTGLGVASGATGNILFQIQLTDQFYGSPVVDTQGNVLECGVNGTVYSLSPSGAINWSDSLPDSFQGTPAVDASGNVVVQGMNGNIWSLNGATGAVNWTQTVGGQFDGFTAPLIDANGNIYTNDEMGNVYSISGETGSFNWTTNLGTPDYLGPYNGCAISPTGSLYVTTPDGVFSLNSSTGAINWMQFGINDTIYGVPTVDPKGNVVVGGFTNGGIYSLDGPTGTINWSTFLPGIGDDFGISQGIALDPTGNIIVDAANGMVASLNGQSGSVNWLTSVSDDFFASPTVDSTGNVLITSLNGTVYAFSGVTGTMTWQLNLGTSKTNGAWGSLAMDGSGHLYAATANGGVYTIN